MEPSVEQVLSYGGARDKGPPVKGKARTVLLVLTVLLGAGVLLVLGPSFLLLAAVAFNRTIDEPEARADVAWLAGGAGNAPASLRVLKAVCEDGPDSSVRWYKLWVNPAEMDAFKANVRHEMERGSPGDVQDADTLDRLPAFDPPRWWRPQELPDAELLHHHYHWLVVSRRTGTVYLLSS
jgi:hypothetical protein